MGGGGKRTGGTRRWTRGVPLILLFCMALVGFWEVMAWRSARPWQAFRLRAKDFAGFCPAPVGWRVERVAAGEEDPLAPNLLAFLLTGHGGTQAVVRLVHGYNMPMCMKIKGYEALLLRDERKGSEGEAPDRVQVWRLTSETGTRSIWVTRMVQAKGFESTDIDTCSMSFPRVGTPDDPGWSPRGLTWESVRHPGREWRRFWRARWNAARCGWLTLLRLRQPAWADEDLLTLVTSSVGEYAPGDEEVIAAHVRAAHDAVLAELRAWGATTR